MHGEQLFHHSILPSVGRSAKMKSHQRCLAPPTAVVIDLFDEDYRRSQRRFLRFSTLMTL
jgi:hypothetical protein